MRGRPTKYDPAHAEQVRELALAGKTDEEIAAELGVSRSTLALWKARHSEFSDALRAWKGEADDAIELSLFNKALGGDTTACIFWLKNRRSADWRDKQDIIHEVGDDLRLMLETARARLAPPKTAYRNIDMQAEYDALVAKDEANRAVG